MATADLGIGPCNLAGRPCASIHFDSLVAAPRGDTARGVENISESSEDESLDSPGDNSAVTET
jgi:hypothetical protein